MNIPLLSSIEILQKNLEARVYPQKSSYFAMYSSWYGGIITDPSLMLVPVDDHLVHRGDGVFEAMKATGNKIFLMNEHLDRLENSSAQIGIKWPFSREQMITVIQETLAVANAAAGRGTASSPRTSPETSSKSLVRLFMSRGPGGFTTNPYESVGTQVYCIITEFKPFLEAKYQSGVKTGRSAIPPKQDWFATIKSCNYLQNVLMKKEAVDRGLDFTFGFGDNGFLTESSTENVVIVNSANELVRPRLKQILKGTTMIRALHLAESLVKKGELKAVLEKDIQEQDLIGAKEAMMIGTTLDVLPVTEYEGKKIGSGTPGPIATALRQLVIEDIRRL